MTGRFWKMTDEKRQSQLTEKIKILQDLLKVAQVKKEKRLEGITYGSLGECYFSLGQNDKAVEYFELQLNIAIQIEDQKEEISAHSCLGDCHYDIGDYHKAMEHFKIVLRIAKRTEDKKSEGSAYDNLGCCYHSLGRYDKAIEYHKMHLNISEQIGDKAGEGQAYANLGVCYSSLFQYDNAIKHCERRLEIAKGIGDEMGEGKAHGKLRHCYFQLGQYHIAIKHLEKELAIAKQFRDKAREGRAYGVLGLCYYSLSQYKQAIEYQTKSLKISKQIGDKEGEGNAHSGLGNCYLHLGRNDKAMDHHKESLVIAKHRKDKIKEGHQYGNLGNCYAALCQFDEAIKHYQKQLDSAKKFGEKRSECASHHNFSVCYMALGLYGKAMEHLEMAKNIAEETRDKVRLGPVYDNIGVLCTSLGQYHKAIRHFEMALDIIKQSGDKRGEGRVCGNFGHCYDTLGKLDKALELHKLHLSIALKIEDRIGKGMAYINLGNCHESFGHFDEAIKCYEMALKIAKENNHKLGEGAACGNLGNCYRVVGKNGKALDYLKMHLNIAKQIGNSGDEAKACANLSYYYCTLGQWDKAEQYCSRSMQCYEKLFENTPKQDHFKVSVRDTFMKIHKRSIELLLCQDKREDALVFAEMARSRALTELMSTSHPTRRADVTESWVSDLPGVREVVESLGSTVLFFSVLVRKICAWAVQPHGSVVLEKSCVEIGSPNNQGCDLAQNVEDFHSLINKTREIIRSGSTMDCEDRSLSFLYPEVLKEAKTKRRTVVPSSATACASLPGLSQREISQDRAPLNTATPPTTSTGAKHRPNHVEMEEPQLEDLLKRLYQYVLQPVRQFVEGSKVVVVPDGPLPLIPFAALLDEKSQYIAESLQVRLIPSLTAAKMIEERPQEPESQASPLIVGDPDVGEIKVGEETIRVPRLPHANEEAKMIGQLLNAQPLTGRNATKEIFLEKLENANLIHIAAHGDMERGEILLAPNPDSDTSNLEDVMVKISDLEDKRVTAKLVVLSCCYSGRGEVRAEGVIGIARAFLGAGARAVVVSLWAVDDAATLYFMREFYGHLIVGERVNEAIHRAMKAMRETEEFRHPRYWSPFILIGEDAILFTVHSGSPDVWACSIF